MKPPTRPQAAAAKLVCATREKDCFPHQLENVVLSSLPTGCIRHSFYGCAMLGNHIMTGFAPQGTLGHFIPTARYQKAQDTLALRHIKLPTISPDVNAQRGKIPIALAAYSKDADEKRVATPKRLCEPMKRHGRLHGETVATEQMHLNFRQSSQSTTKDNPAKARVAHHLDRTNASCVQRTALALAVAATIG